MADQKDQTEPTLEDHVSARAEQAAAWVREDLVKKHGNKMLIGFLVVIALIVGGLQYKKSQEAKAVATAEALGKGLNYIYTGRLDSAKLALDSLLNNGASGLVRGKAALLVANIHFQSGKFDSAAILYAIARDNAGSADLIRSAADHGLAATQIEKGDFAGAARSLEKFIDTYGKRTGNPEDRYQQKEPADLAPTVSDAMLKLALCYKELGQPDKARETAEKILKIYGDSRQASVAKKLVASL